MNTQVRYTVALVISELKKLLKKDIPAAYRNWARDGITYVERNPEADVLDFPNNIFAYIQDDPMPAEVRELVEGILQQGIREGSGIAARSLGALYDTGQIGEQSCQKARELYEIAAETGDEQAVENLGYCYYYGRDCEVDYQKAYECFAKGAFIGRVTSLYKIADMYKNGYYVRKNEREAYRIYSHCIDVINSDREAAAAYDADVYVRYAECYMNGTGCEKDLLTALFWAQRAEYDFRKREADHVPFARSGVDWAMRVAARCRQMLDQEGEVLPVC